MIPDRSTDGQTNRNPVIRTTNLASPAGFVATLDHPRIAIDFEDESLVVVLDAPGDAGGTALEDREGIGIVGELELPQSCVPVNAVPAVEGDDCGVAHERRTDRRVERTVTARALVGDSGCVTELVVRAEFASHPSRTQRAHAGVPQSASSSTAGVEHVGDVVGRAVGEAPRREPVANEPVPTVRTGNGGVLVVAVEEARTTTADTIVERMGVDCALPREPPVQQ